MVVPQIVNCQSAPGVLVKLSCRPAPAPPWTYAGLPRTGTLQATAPGPVPAPTAPSVLVGSPMPDLKGTAKKLLLPLLLRQDISVSITGSGFVAVQDPPPGTIVREGMRVVLELQ